MVAVVELWKGRAALPPSQRREDGCLLGTFGSPTKEFLKAFGFKQVYAAKFCGRIGQTAKRQCFSLLTAKFGFFARILFTDVLLDFRATVGGTGQDFEEMQKYFGNLGSSAATLFRAISDGISWQTAADALQPAGQFWVQLFHFYIAFCSFALLNVMTGAIRDETK